jgi:hypothetical protein
MNENPLAVEGLGPRVDGLEEREGREGKGKGNAGFPLLPSPTRGTENFSHCQKAPDGLIMRVKNLNDKYQLTLRRCGAHRRPSIELAQRSSLIVVCQAAN